MPGERKKDERERRDSRINPPKKKPSKTVPSSPTPLCETRPRSLLLLLPLHRASLSLLSLWPLSLLQTHSTHSLCVFLLLFRGYRLHRLLLPTNGVVRSVNSAIPLVRRPRGPNELASRGDDGMQKSRTKSLFPSLLSPLSLSLLCV